MATIVVAEDDELTRYLLKLSLEETNHEVKAVTNGREAIQLIIMEKPAVIVLDLMMPGVNGGEVITQVRDTPELADTPIIVVTGTAQPETIAGTEQADLILSKPIPIDTLIAEIRKFLDD
ncbi:MAG: response regulator [Chloroflexota bacterium]